MDEDQFVEFFSELCNAVEQGVFGPYDDDLMHTSKEARRAADRIVRVLEKHELL